MEGVFSKEVDRSHLSIDAVHCIIKSSDFIPPILHSLYLIFNSTSSFSSHPS